MNAVISRIFGGALLCLLLALQPASLLAEELPAQELIVSAAASLTNAFTELGKAYQRDNPGYSIILNFGGSGQLLQQINRGAPVDVFATADQETMNRAQKRNLIVPESRIDFVRNALVLIAPADSVLEIVNLGQLRAGTVSRIAISNPASAIPG